MAPAPSTLRLIGVAFAVAAAALLAIGLWQAEQLRRKKKSGGRAKKTREAGATRYRRPSDAFVEAVPYRAGELPRSVASHVPMDWNLLVGGDDQQPYLPISFRDPVPYPSLGVKQPISWDLSKTGSTCGPDIQNPPFVQTNNACWYARGFMKMQ